MLNARYFDGKTSRLYQVQFRVEQGMAYITGDANREVPFDQLRVSEKMLHTARRVTLPDGAYLECHDQAGFDELLHSAGFKESIVVRLQLNWRAVTVTAGLLIVISILSYLYILPWSAKVIANHLPADVEQAIGAGSLEFLDGHLFTASKLPLERQGSIRASFSRLYPADLAQRPVELVFRSSKIGANAFALPSRQIVLTDEIVTLLDNDEELMAVLGHELGHIVHHHFMRRLIQSSTVAAGATLLFGDVSNVIAGVPTLLLDLKYSRDAERDADDFAIAVLKTTGIPVTTLVDVFEKLQKQQKGPEPIPYLSTHPLVEDRLEWIRKADQRVTVVKN